MESISHLQKAESNDPKPAVTSSSDYGKLSFLLSEGCDWPEIKEETFFATKDISISAINNEAETIIDSESGSISRSRSSFRSILQDASSLEFYTEVLDAFRPIESTRPVLLVAAIQCEEGFLSLRKTFTCVIGDIVQEKLVAHRNFSMDVTYSIYRVGVCNKEKVGEIEEIGPGQYRLLDTRKHKELGKIAFRAKERSGVLFRLADGSCVGKADTDTQIKLEATHPKWIAEAQHYELPLYGKQPRISTKNFQMTAPDSSIVLQLTKVGRKRFELRHSPQVPSLQSFGLAVCSLIQSNL